MLVVNDAKAARTDCSDDQTPIYTRETLITDRMVKSGNGKRVENAKLNDFPTPNSRRKRIKTSTNASLDGKPNS